MNYNVYFSWTNSFGFLCAQHKHMQFLTDFIFKFPYIPEKVFKTQHNVILFLCNILFQDENQQQHLRVLINSLFVYF